MAGGRRAPASRQNRAHQREAERLARWSGQSDGAASGLWASWGVPHDDTDGVSGLKGGRGWRDQAERLARTCTVQIPGLIGVYAHGSAALGGFGPGSDLDILVVADGDADWDLVGAELLANWSDDRALELSVVQSTASAGPSPPWPYLVHVNSAESRVALDTGGGDPDLIAHYAVTLAAGVVLTGPPPGSVFGPVARTQLVTYLRGELRWGKDNADQRYAVLNACRAAAYSSDGSLLSKPAGAIWWLRRFGADPLVTQALRAQQDGHDLGPCSPSARIFVDERIANL